MLLACLASFAMTMPVSTAAQAPIEDEQEPTQAAEEESGTDEREEGREEQQAAEDADDEEVEEIDDFIPSEMISEDLAVDMPIDI